MLSFGVLRGGVVCAGSGGESSSSKKLGVQTPAKPWLPPGLRGPLKQLQGSKALTTIDKVYSGVTQLGEKVVVERWDALPSSQKVFVGLTVAFVIASMDKVNMSLAIIPLAREFGWGPSVAGLVQSGFFYGYLLSQIPGGILCSKFGGRAVISKGVGLWSAATMGLPFIASTIPGICIARAALGLGEAVAPSAATDIVGRSVPKEERSRATSFIFGGLNVGSIAGLLIVPFLIDHFGWASVFFTFGCMGTFWVLWFEDLLSDIRVSDPDYYQVLSPDMLSTESSDKSEEDKSIPWRAIIRSNPVQALACAHFSSNWFQYTMMAWLPSYITDTLRMDISHAAQVSLFPPVVAYLCGILSGQAADGLISAGWDTSVVRKLIQGTSFLCPSGLLVAAALADDPTIEVSCVALAIGVASFCMGGLYSNHQDLSTKYSSFLLGMTNTTAAIPGILGVWLTGVLYENTGDWHLSLFAPAVVTMCLGMYFYTIYGSAEPQSFDNNKPFPVEDWLKGVLEGAKASF